MESGWGAGPVVSSSPFSVQFLQQPDGGPAQFPKAVLGSPGAMYWASLRGPGSRLGAQGWGLELEVVQAGDVHLQGWIGMEGEGEVSTPPVPPPPSSPTV